MPKVSSIYFDTHVLRAVFEGPGNLPHPSYPRIRGRIEPRDEPSDKKKEHEWLPKHPFWFPEPDKDLIRIPPPQFYPDEEMGQRPYPDVDEWLPKHPYPEPYYTPKLGRFPEEWMGREDHNNRISDRARVPNTSGVPSSKTPCGRQGVDTNTNTPYFSDESGNARKVVTKPFYTEDSGKYIPEYGNEEFTPKSQTLQDSNAYWTCKGDITDDNIGNNGTIYGSPIFTDDYISFPTQNDYVQVANSSDISPTIDLSIAFLFYMNDPHPNNPPIAWFPVKKRTAVSDGYWVRIYQDAVYWAWHIEFCWKSGSLVTYNFPGGGFPSGWNHFIFIGGASGLGKIYINGVNVASASGASSVGSNTQNLTIMTRTGLPDGNPDGSARIRNLVIDKKYWSNTQIAEAYLVLK